MTKKAAHRPTAYKIEYSHIAWRFALLGAIDADLAEAFEVSEQTINAWKKKHPDFLESLKKGKIAADAKVVGALFNRATGYDAKAVKLFMHEGNIIEHEYTVHYPPDITACIYWLKNRRPGQWRDKPAVAVTVNAGDVVNLDRPPEEWGMAEIEAELRRRGEVPITAYSKIPREDQQPEI